MRILCQVYLGHLSYSRKLEVIESRKQCTIWRPPIGCIEIVCHQYPCPLPSSTIHVICLILQVFIIHPRPYNIGMARRRVGILVGIFGVITLVALLIGSFTPAFLCVLRVLPPHADLFFHALSHAILVVVLGTSTSISALSIFFLSTVLAVVVEGMQSAVVVHRSGSLEDIGAALFGSLAVFILRYKFPPTPQPQPVLPV